MKYTQHVTKLCGYKDILIILYIVPSLQGHTVIHKFACDESPISS